MDLFKNCKGCSLNTYFEMNICSVPFNMIDFNSFSLCGSLDTVMYGLDIVEELRLYYIDINKQIEDFIKKEELL